MNAYLTVIIPTLCSDERGPGLLRAIQSAHAASAQAVDIIVVANGSQVSAEVVDSLKPTDIRLLRQEVGSLPKALALGRSEVRTEYFGFLDDDDELLPGSLDRRLHVLQAHADVAAVVSNGFREEGGQLSAMNPDMAGIAEEPLRKLLDRNWLASCAGLFRTAAVSEAFFLKPHGYGEWTWLGFQMCMAGLQFRAIESKDYIVHDTAMSLSKSQAYYQSYIALYDRMLECPVPSWARQRILEKRSAAHHYLSVRALSAGNLQEAMLHHIRSLYPWQGLRYVFYGRHIVASAVSRALQTR